MAHGEYSPPPSSDSAGSANNRQLGRSAWPEAIALPTASGKTACMDIAVFALAAQARRLDVGQPITAPRRIFFVVDRRIIVDEAHERARRLARKLAEAKYGILKTVKDSLCHIGSGGCDWPEDEPPLAVHALRGGMYRSEAWARNPLQPTIVASTVDQVGSRILFRAYGRGFGTWPIYAGLIANDSLILLDEAHCSQPFQQTLDAVRKYRTWADSPLERCFHPVVMSATPPPGLQEVFDDASEEGTDPSHPLGRRQLARKPARLKTVAKAKGKDASTELSKELALAARELIADGRRAVVVFANRVATARETYRLLRQSESNIVLLTGRMRSVDKDSVVERLRHLGLHSDQSEDRHLREPVIVVATQTLEVGADLDFDGLVTECASLDALRQRFGRLNRMGRNVNSRAEILIRGDQVKFKEPDPVYGNALTETWAWLRRVEDENGIVDFGIAALKRVLPCGEVLNMLNAPALDAPVMLPAHVDCWGQTAPEPQPSPDVSLFLHGPQEGAPDVQVCWRADLDLVGTEAQDEALSTLSLCPPSSVETLPVPIGVFKRWLSAEDTEDHSADVEGADTQEATHTRELDDDSENAVRRVVRWRGRETGRDTITADPSEIRPGDVIVIPTGHPGPWQQLGDLQLDSTDPAGALDIGDQAHRLARAKPILRLHPDLVDVWPDSLSAKSAAKSLLDRELERKYEEDPDEVVDAVGEVLAELAAGTAPDGWTWLPQAAKELAAEYSNVRKLRRACRLTGAVSLVVAGRRRVPVTTHEVDAFSDEDDTSASGISHRNGNPVRLRTHLPGVEDYARRHAVGCGLPEPLVHAVARAGLLHDLGKADPRFQSLLRGGARWDGRELWAKSADMPDSRSARQRARKASGYPEGGRHELLSVRMAETAPDLLPTDTDLHDLVLHLVASHHGYCRPFAPVVADDESVTAQFELNGHRMRWCGPTYLERLDSGGADRFWRLTRRYGWWGLAWLETLLRLADWRRSEWEETHDG
ncbi:MAG: type I-U CRISPR-associated helicase/endonuclease Cas3 [Gammaproteobacteria bacterium]|nr:type I-U CRISPR-associated helicase/endonuclease Cas3 [Gammaproteobacteria bacterium]